MSFMFCSIGEKGERRRRLREAICPKSDRKMLELRDYCDIESDRFMEKEEDSVNQASAIFVA